MGMFLTRRRGAGPQISTAHATSLVFMGQIGSALGYFVAVLVLARALVPAERGTLAFVVSTSILTAEVASFGIPSAVAYYASRRSRRAASILGEAVRFSLISGTVLGVAAALTIAVLGLQPPGVDRLALVALAGGAVSTMVGTLGGIFLVSIRRPVAFLIAGLGNSWIYASAVVICFAAGVLDLRLTIILWVTTRAAGAAFTLAVAIAMTGIRSGDARTRRLGLSYGRRAWIGSLATMVNARADQMLMGFISTEHALGIYAVAVNAAEVLGYLPNAIGATLTPRIARESSAYASTTATAAFRIIAPITASLALLAFATGWFLIPAAFGAAYAESVTPFALLLPGAVGTAALTTFSAALNGSNLAGRASIATSAMLATEITGDLLLIGPYGASGAAAAASLAFAVGGTTAAVLQHRQLPYPVRDLLPRPRELAAIGRSGLMRLRRRTEDG
jgi:O-antigen/teichoic acid export membrane protein